MIEYKISGNIVKYKNADQIDIHSWEETFTDKNPISARTEAIKRYKDILSEIKDAGHSLEEKLTKGGDPFDDLDLGIGVYLKIVDPYDKTWDGIEIGLADGLGTELEASKWVWTDGGNDVEDFPIDDYEWRIIGVGGFGSSAPLLIDGLENEMTIYKFFKYDMNGFETNAPCFNHNDGKIKEHRILKVPFDWNAYNEMQSYDIPVQETKKIESDVTKYLDIIKNGEGKQVEFKSTLNYCEKEKGKKDYIKFAIAKTIAAFLNTNGGLLFIGVGDNKELKGLENDYQTFGSENKKDSFNQSLNSLIKDYFSKDCHQHIDAKFHTNDELDFMVVTVAKSLYPVTLKNKSEKEFYIRGIAATEKLDIEETIKWVLEKFKGEK